MGYMKIPNLYKSIDILKFKEVYALEKVHGTSAHVAWRNGQLVFSAGGSNPEQFRALFDAEKLEAILKERHANQTVTIFGEAYGGKVQRMSESYGKSLSFIVFDVQIDGMWLDVPTAERVATHMGLEFVPYEYGPADLAWIDSQRDADSIVAIRRGCGPGHIREGVVLRPPFEVTLNNGSRCMTKHKRDEFRETATPRVVDDPAKLQVLTEAQAIADEWVTPHRVEHVLQKFEQPHSIQRTKEFIQAMMKDIQLESVGEVVLGKEAHGAIGKAAAKLYHKHLTGR